MKLQSDHDELNDCEWLAGCYESGMGHRDIAARLGCAKRTVINWTLHHSLDEHLPDQVSRDRGDLKREWLQQAVDDHGSVRAAARNSERHSASVLQQWAVRYAVDIPDNGDDNSGISGLPDDEWPDHAKTGQLWQDAKQLRRAYHEYLWSPSDIGRWCDVSPGLIRSEMERKGIELRDQGTAVQLRQLRDKGMSLAYRQSVVSGFGQDSDASDTTVEWTRLTD